ncbi:sigma-70 factor domain-containing protein [Mycobacteroides abscessus]|nr:sigma-70 factor domain-containing protein [Mycobacteroides abscessus]
MSAAMQLVKQIEIPEDLPDLLTAEQEVELAKRIEAPTGS